MLYTIPKVLCGVGDEEIFDRIFRSEVLIFIVGGLAVLVGGIVAIAKIYVRHMERMAMIRAGMHPDAVSPSDSSSE